MSRFLLAAIQNVLLRLLVRSCGDSPGVRGKVDPGPKATLSSSWYGFSNFEQPEMSRLNRNCLGDRRSWFRKGSALSRQLELLGHTPEDHSRDG